MRFYGQQMRKEAGTFAFSRHSRRPPPSQDADVVAALGRDATIWDAASPARLASALGLSDLLDGEASGGPARAFFFRDLQAGARLEGARVELGGASYACLKASSRLFVARGPDRTAQLLDVLRRTADLLCLRLAITGVTDEKPGVTDEKLTHVGAWQLSGDGLFLRGPVGGVQLNPLRALVCELTPAFHQEVLRGASSAEEAYARVNRQPVSEALLRPCVARTVDFDPPLTSLGDVWQRTGTGIGSDDSGSVPFLRVAGTQLWMRADTHAFIAL